MNGGTTAPAPIVIDLTGGPSAPRMPLRLGSNTGGPQRSRNGSRLSRIVFTLPNWTDKEFKYLTEEFAPTVKWMIVAKETCPTSGTPHLQGACLFGRQIAFSTLKTYYGFRRAHVEKMNGKPEDSAVYCRKEDSHPFEFGSLPKPGKRNDLVNIVDRVQQGESLRDLAKDDEGGVAIVKFHKGLTVLRGLCRPQRSKMPRIFWYWGSTGTGKTRLALKVARALLRNVDGADPNDIWISSGGLRWFDGYDGQLAVVLDDFRAKSLQGVTGGFSFLLRLLDRYPMSVEFKGGFVSFTPHFIFITCPHPPEVCFQKRMEHVPEDIKQLTRRIDDSDGVICEFNEPELVSPAGRVARRDFVHFQLYGHYPDEGCCVPATP